MKDVIINLLYIASAILFIFGIKWLGRAETARRGNRLSSAGMLLAVVATLLYGGLSWPLVVGGILTGAAIGLWLATRVQMTGMPELVALFNGFGGLASLLVGAAEFHKLSHAGPDAYLAALAAQTGVTVPAAFAAIAISLTILVGVNFTKSTMFESKIRADSLQELRVTYLEWAAQAADTMRAAPAHSDKTVQPRAPAAS